MHFVAKYLPKFDGEDNEEQECDEQEAIYFVMAILHNNKSAWLGVKRTENNNLRSGASLVPLFLLFVSVPHISLHPVPSHLCYFPGILVLIHMIICISHLNCFELLHSLRRGTLSSRSSRGN